MLGIVGPLIPDESILVLSGIFVHQGRLHLIPTLCVAYAGSLFGITLSYVLGRTGGHYVLEKFGGRFGVHHVDRVHNWFERFGRWTLFFGYFVIGVRHFTALIAGASKLEVPVFALYAYPGGLIWVVCFVSIGYFLGDQWSRISHQVDRSVLVAAVIIAAGAFLWFHFRKRRS